MGAEEQQRARPAPRRFKTDRCDRCTRHSGVRTRILHRTSEHNVDSGLFCSDLCFIVCKKKMEDSNGIKFETASSGERSSEKDEVSDALLSSQLAMVANANEAKDWSCELIKIMHHESETITIYAPAVICRRGAEIQFITPLSREECGVVWRTREEMRPWQQAVFPTEFPEAISVAADMINYPACVFREWLYLLQVGYYRDGSEITGTNWSVNSRYDASKAVATVICRGCRKAHRVQPSVVLRLATSNDELTCDQLGKNCSTALPHVAISVSKGTPPTTARKNEAMWGVGSD